jgi:hypothetical protein
MLIWASFGSFTNSTHKSMFNLGVAVWVPIMYVCLCVYLLEQPQWKFVGWNRGTSQAQFFVPSGQGSYTKYLTWGRVVTQVRDPFHASVIMMGKNFGHWINTIVGCYAMNGTIVCELNTWWALTLETLRFVTLVSLNVMPTLWHVLLTPSLVMNIHFSLIDGYKLTFPKVIFSMMNTYS